MNHEENTIQQLIPLIKIIKSRESMYFDALGFTNKNIESSSNDFDQICIFNKFLATNAEKEAELVAVQDRFLIDLGSSKLYSQSRKVNNHSKEMMRLYARSLELVQEAVERAQNSLFGDNGKLVAEFTNFKTILHKIIQQNPLDLHDFAAVFINFSRNKYRRQIRKLKTYLRRLQQGDHLTFREVLAPKDGSDAESEDERTKFKSTDRTGGQNSQTQSPQKLSTRRNSYIGPKPRRNINIGKSSKREDHIPEKTPKQYKKSKTLTAAQLLKFYQIMDLNKKQFLEDHVFEKQAEQQQQKRLIAMLMQKNKFNEDQIKQYYTKCKNFNPKLHAWSNPSNNQNQSASLNHNQSETGSHLSLKTSFIISKAKPGFAFESGSDRSDVELSKNSIQFQSKIKNLSARKRPGNYTSRVRQSNSSKKKIFVVKPPKVFGDDVIPRAQMVTTQWLQSTMGKQRSNSRKHENLRLKRRNNPCPLDNKLFPESFHFTHYPI